MNRRVMNFGAGPATLPEEALRKTQEELLDFEGSGASIMELSHRGPIYDRVHQEAKSLLKELLSLPETHEVLFLQGGASQVFAQIAMNFLSPQKSASYLLTGVWGEKAHAEALDWSSLQGGERKVFVANDTTSLPSGEKSYFRVPKPEEIHTVEGLAYMHYTSNETIHGVQFDTEENSVSIASHLSAKAPLICDMSSDFLWKPLDCKNYDFIYAGAQKNVGPSGLVIAVAKKDFIETGSKNIPKIFQYRTSLKNDSLYNTPPTFAIYLMRNVMRWVKDLGGLPGMEARNREKGTLLYQSIEKSRGFYNCPVEEGSRSFMNAVFKLPSPELEALFLSKAKAENMIGLKGHRSVGGIRISMYNAVKPEWVSALSSLMDEFARTHG